MANELRDYLDSLGLKEEAIDKAVELAVPDSFRSDLAALGGKNKALEAELADLRPLKDAPKRIEALKRVGVDYDSQPRSVKKTFDAIPADKLDDLEYVANVVNEEGIAANLTAEQQQVATEQSGAERITNFATSVGDGRATAESYEAAVQAAGSQEELDAVYQRFGKNPATT